MKVYVVGYKAVGEIGCDVDKVFSDRDVAEKFATMKNGEHGDTSIIGYVVEEFVVHD